MPQFDHVPSPYGAQMGRRTIMDDPTAKVRLFRIRFVDGDYDDGGVYWGGSVEAGPVYCARGEGVQLFLRAPDRDEAKARVSADHPGLKFYR